MFGIIYKIKNIFTGKKYIGQTVKTLDSRKKEHKTNVIKGTGHYIHNSMRKHDNSMRKYDNSMRKPGECFSGCS